MLDTAPLTLLLQEAHAGDRAAADRAYSALYSELLKIARARLRVHQAPTLLDTQALVHCAVSRRAPCTSAVERAPGCAGVFCAG